ncbi:MAG: tryptophan synthase subunit beta [Clostridia bacterium]|nr:tryptophan synthase subunit beta [Clostridia bacterium]
MSKFGIYGGQFVSEQLMQPLKDLEEAFVFLQGDFKFNEIYENLLRDYVGRETPLYFAKNLTSYFKGPNIFLKREDLNHTGAHKINNALGQALIAKHMNKEHIICETGAGQHGVATATACALLNMKCTVFMGYEDVKRQKSNVQRIQMLGAKVIPVHSGSKVLKDATNEAIRFWIEHIEDCHYIIGSAIGPHPYPMIVKHFQSVIGTETRKQCLEKLSTLPDQVIACVGGGSNAIGMFNAFINDSISLVGVEAAGKGLNTSEHAATLTCGTLGILHGSFMYLLQEEGNIKEVYSLSAGLDYPGVGPEHCYLKDIGRVRYEAITDFEALDAFKKLCELEGIIPALESAHAIAQCFKEVKHFKKHQNIVVCLSGRGDKDLETVLALENTHEEF